MAKDIKKQKTNESADNLEIIEEHRDKIGPLSGEDIDQTLPEKYERPTPRAGPSRVASDADNSPSPTRDLA